MSTQNQREIIMYATRGGKMEKIMTDVTTWGELKPLVKKAGYDISNLLAAESFTKHDLVNDLALLPVENFRLFLRPKQTKSGAEMSYKELRGAIKEILDNNPDAKEHFNQGKNYTTKGTEELRSLYNSYTGGSKKSTPKKEVVEKVREVVETVKKAKVNKKDKKPKKERVKKAEEVLDQKSEPIKEQVSQKEEKVPSLETIIGLLKAHPSTNNIEEAIYALESEIKGSTHTKKVVEKVETEQEKVAREAREMGY